MAVLEKTQILEILKEQKNNIGIPEAIRHEQRLRMHIDPVIDRKNISPAFTAFLKSVEDFLTADKFKKFQMLIRFPLPTVELTDTIFSEFIRIFEAQNFFFSFEFVNPELAEDFDEYLNQIEDADFWQEEAFEAMKTAINSIMIVDLPAQQTTPRPEPYYYLINISRVKAYKKNKKGIYDFIIFEDGPDKIIVLDDNHYRVLKKDIGGEFTIFDVEAPHNLGYTPARGFWKNPAKGPITNSLGQLDDVLFWHYSIAYYNSYGVFPIYWAYKQKCNYKDEAGNTCDQHGNIEYSFLGERRTKRCPVCEANKMIGAGSFLKVPAPSRKDDPDLRNPVGMLGVDKDSLEFTQKQQQNRKDEIYLSCVGRNGEANNDQAQNEKQISAAFESKQNVLLRIKKNFEVIHRWTLETVARLRYGKENFKSATVNYGDKFYLKSDSEILSEYETGKKLGLPMFSLAAIREERDETKYKNNLDMKERRRILAELEELQDLTIAEVTALYPAVISKEKLLFKLEFDSLIKEFERENGPINRFMEALDFETRIFLIKKNLYEYTSKRAGTSSQINAEQNAGVTK